MTLEDMKIVSGKFIRTLQSVAETIMLYVEDILNWHENIIEDMMYKYTISAYSIGWAGFWSGVALVLILQWIF